MGSNRPPTRLYPPRPASDASDGRLAALRAPRGRAMLALGFFVLTELFSLPVLGITLGMLPLVGDRPLLQANPTMFWLCLALAILLPGATAAVVYLRLARIFPSAGRSD